MCVIAAAAIGNIAPQQSAAIVDGTFDSLRRELLGRWAKAEG